MINEDLNMEVVNKHFKDVTTPTIPPGKTPSEVPISLTKIKESIDKYWSTQTPKIKDLYTIGKVSANTGQAKSIDNVLTELGLVLIEGIKTSNNNASITNENLRDHFAMLLSVLKVIGRDINALYAPVKHDLNMPVELSLDETTPKFDSFGLLVALNGYIIEKLHG